MAKKQTAAAGIGISAGVGLAVYLLAQPLLAFLVIRGWLPEGRAMALQVITAVIAGLTGGLLAVWLVFWRALPAALAAAFGMVLITALTGVLFYDGILLTVESLVRAACMVAGGLAAALSAGKSARGGKRKKKKIRGTRKR